MRALKQHPLLSADLQEAFDWYEDQRPGLGWEFKDDFKTHFRNLPRDTEIWLLAVLHASRDTETVLAERKRHFRG